MQIIFIDKFNTEKSDMNLNNDDYNVDDMKSPLHKMSVTTTNNNHHVDTYVRQIKHSRKNNLLKILISLIIILLTSLVVFVTLYISVNKFDNTTKQDNRNTLSGSKNKNVCYTAECVQISARIIEIMDQSVKPCDNFYQYACGGWLKQTPVPDSKTRYSRFEMLSNRNSIVIKQILDQLIKSKRNASTTAIRKAALYYKSCMNIKQIEMIGDTPMKELIKRLGSWPVTDPNFDVNTWDAMDALVAVHKNISEAPVFNIYVTKNIKDSNENVLVFDQSGLIIDKESYLRNSSFHSRHRAAYHAMARSIVTIMGANETGLKLMDKVFEFETKLAEITMSVSDRRDYRSIYENMTLGAFCKKTEIPVKWMRKFVNKIFFNIGKTVPLSSIIVSYSTQYIKKAYKLFIALPKDIQASYIMWHAVKVMSSVVLGKYQAVLDEYFMTAYGTKARKPRWENCIGSTLNAFGYALARPFVETVYDQTAKDMSTEMIQAIKNVFASNLDNMSWMDEKTRQYAKLKASRILENIGYPEFILNNTALENEYYGLIVKDGEYFKNFMYRREYKNLKNYEKLGKPVDKSEWTIAPTTVNAYYSPTENKIGFPAGILQWPFYDKRAPRAVSYGAIGMVVGHEITHGFDDQGKDFTIEGNFDNWWTDHSSEQFKEKTKCFIKQYSNFSLFGKYMNGKQTLGEDLADNGGIRQSLEAYRIWVKKNGEEKKLPGLDLTPEQLYFLAFSQVWCTTYRESAAINQIENGLHTLSLFRVLGTLQNNEDFSKAYKCPLGSTMNPKNKCKIW